MRISIHDPNFKVRRIILNECGIKVWEQFEKAVLSLLILLRRRVLVDRQNFLVLKFLNFEIWEKPISILKMRRNNNVSELKSPIIVFHINIT